MLADPLSLKAFIDKNWFTPTIQGRASAINNYSSLLFIGTDEGDLQMFDYDNQKEQRFPKLHLSVIIY
jgi:hypothetical protein